MNKVIILNTAKIAAIVLIVVGSLGLMYGGFSYTRESPNVSLSLTELSVEDYKTDNIPVWIGAGALVAGTLILLMRVRN